jgi:hypothetical protein
MSMAERHAPVQANERQEHTHAPEVTARPGSGKFIGTQKQDGTDASQRKDARQIYEGIIGSSGVQGARAVFGWVRNRFRRAEAVIGDYESGSVSAAR